MKIEEYRALSIKQPWADLILKGIKNIEVRNWDIKKRGPFIIHVSSTIDWKTIQLLNYDEPLTLPKGVLIAYAEIKDVIKFTEASWIDHFKGHRVVHPMLKDTWGAILENVIPFEKPIPHRGKLYFFPIDADRTDQVEKQLDKIL